MKHFNKAYIEKQLEIIDGYLPQPIHLYVIGGGAMGFYDLKTATKDIDVILTKKKRSKISFEGITAKQVQEHRKNRTNILENENTCCHRK